MDKVQDHEAEANSHEAKANCYEAEAKVALIFEPNFTFRSHFPK